MPAKNDPKSTTPATTTQASPAKPESKPATQAAPAPAPAKTESKPTSTQAPAKTEQKPAAAPPKPAAAPPKPAAAKPATQKSGAPVPETVLKSRKTKRNAREMRQKLRVQTKKRNSKRRAESFKRAEQYVKEYRSQERSLVHFRRQARNSGNFFIEPEPKLAFVVRVRGIMNMHPKPRKILQLLRLRQVNNGVFLKLTKATLSMLKLVEPYVTWGTPNLKTVRELIYKRGFLKINQQRIPITDNKMIEQRLNHHGCVCIEDIIHEIFTVGPNFPVVNRALWAFHLNPPKGGYNRVNKHYNDGGDFGSREEKINELVQSMN